MARPAAWKGECVMATALYKQCDAFTSERYEDVLLLRFADHPFIFLIQERETGKIIFMGRVERP